MGILTVCTRAYNYSQIPKLFVFFQGQNLGTILKCYFLGSTFKILSFEFFLMKLKCIF